MFKLCSPGGDAQCGQDAILNVQKVITKQDDQHFLLVPTRTAAKSDNVNGIVKEVQVRGRKPKVQLCDDRKCGQCRRCRSRACWNKMGETHAAEVVSVYGDKQSAWAVWRDEGVGCLMCYNHRLALERAGMSLNAGENSGHMPMNKLRIFDPKQMVFGAA